MLRPVLAFAMIASETDKGHGIFRLVCDNGQVELYLKYHSEQQKEKRMVHSNSCCTCDTQCRTEWQHAVMLRRNGMAAFFDFEAREFELPKITTKLRKNSKNSSAGHRNTSRIRHHVKENENMAGCLQNT